MSTLRAIDVCSGAGGFSLGLHRAGFDVLGVELEKDAVETHRRHVGPCELADITTWHPPHDADLVVGGVPCQSFSVAGERKGLADERGQLFHHLIRIAREAHAKIVIMENVEGLLSTDGALPAIYQAMQSGSDGFPNVQHQVLCAADYGTPQCRYRLFIVGTQAGVRWKWPAPSHGEGPMLFGLRPWVTVRQAFGLDLSPHAHGRLEGASGWNGQRVLDVDRPSTTVTGRRNAELIDRPALALGAGHDTYPDGDASRELHEALTRARLIDRPATTIAGDSRLWEAGHHANAADAIQGEQPSRNQNAVRLTVDQCAILQGFPSGWEWSGTTKESKHRQVGNAVPPQLGEAIGGSARAALIYTVQAELSAAE